MQVNMMFDPDSFVFREQLAKFGLGQMSLICFEIDRI